MSGGPERGGILEDLYQKLTDDEDARACTDISEAACRETPASFFLTLVASSLSKLADSLASAKTVLAWLASGVGAPAVVLAFLVPVRESGSMLPQLLVAGYVRRLAVRKWVWVAGSVAQALSVAGIAFVAMHHEGDAAGFAILGLVVAFSLARGFCSIASKDVLGKTIPKSKRGQLTGWAASAAGLVSVVAGALFALTELRAASANELVLVVLAAAALWGLAATVFAFVNEFPGETAGGKNAIGEAFARLRILVEDRPFRRFVVARALLMCSALSAPYYTALAHERGGSGLGTLAGLVAAGGLADLLSGPFWGRLADRSSRRVMALGGAGAAGMGVVVSLLAGLAPAVVASAWFLPFWPNTSSSPTLTINSMTIILYSRYLFNLHLA